LARFLWRLQAGYIFRGTSRSSVRRTI
jgi:hypothetical protein